MIDAVFGDCIWFSSFCIALHRWPGWRLYAAYEEQGEGASLAVAAMLVHEGMAQLGLLGTEGAGGGKCQAALIQHCTRDAATAGAGAIFAETEAPAAGEQLTRTGIAEPFSARINLFSGGHSL